MEQHKYYRVIQAICVQQHQYDLHEDHIGAIAHIWPKLLCNIYATPFTSVLIQEKFKEKKIDIGNKLKIVDLNGFVNLGPFKIEFVTLTHSILEPIGSSIE